MTVPRLSGLWDEVGGSFMQFAQMLPKMIHPNADYLKDIRKQLALDPTLMQKFADLEKESPGSLDRLGLGGLAKQVSGMSESSDLLFERKKRDALKTPMSEDDDSQFRSKVLGIKDPLAREQDRAQLAGTKANTAYVISQEKYTQLKTEIDEATKAGDIARAQMAVNQLGTYNKAKLIVDEIAARKKSPFKAYLDNELAPDQLAAIRAVPEYASGWESEFSIWKEKNDLEEAKKNRSVEYYRISQNGAEEEINKQRARLVQAIALFSGGSMDDGMAFQKLSAQQKIQLERSSPENVPPELQSAYRGMKDAKNYQAKMLRQEVRSQLTYANPRIKEALKSAFTGGSTDERVGGINAANQAFLEAYTPLLEQGLVREIPQIGYAKGWTGGVKEVFWTNADPDVQSTVAGMGFKIKGPTQEKVDNATSKQEEYVVDYDAIANDIMAASGGKSDAIEREIMVASGAKGVDKVKLRTAVERKRGSKK